jgi:hypothetical protein
MGGTEIAEFRPQSYRTLQAVASKTAAFYSEFNGLGVVQGELPNKKAKAPRHTFSPTSRPSDGHTFSSQANTGGQKTDEKPLA